MAKSIFLLFPLLSHSFQPGPVVLKEGATTTREKVVFFWSWEEEGRTGVVGSTLRTTFRTDDSQYPSNDVPYRRQSVLFGRRSVPATVSTPTRCAVEQVRGLVLRLP
jgi:hypothetical protein